MCRSFSPPATVAADAPPAKRLAQHLSLLLDVVRSRRWRAFEAIALSNPTVYRMIDAAVPSHEEFGGASLLHACLRHDPPVRIVAKMVDLTSDRTAALRRRDANGRTPLHVAAACRADPHVIKLLAHADPSTCCDQDKEGCTPLHLACGDDSSSDTKDDESTFSQDDQAQTSESRSHGAVRALLSESLEASLVEDEEGTSPLECAIIADASYDVVSLLQKASMEALRRKERLGKRPRLTDDNARLAVRRRRSAVLGS